MRANGPHESATGDPEWSGFVMQPSHPKWWVFLDRLAGAEGCDFQRDPDDGYRWRCGCKLGRNRAAEFLHEAGADVAASLTSFASQGADCDCKILFIIAGGCGA